MREPERIDEILQFLPAIAGGLTRAAMAGGSLAARTGARVAGTAARTGAQAARNVGQATARTAKTAGTALARGTKNAATKFARSTARNAVRKVGRALGDGAAERQGELDAREQRLQQKEKELELSHTFHTQVGNILAEACWKGYEQKGMKTMFGKRYPNCVKKKRKLRETMEHLNEEGLRAWFGNSRSKGGKPGWVQVVSGKPCARQPGQKSTPKCVSSSKRASMTPAQRRSAQARKRKADPNQRFKSGAAKPTYVSTDKPKRKTKGKRK
jgi:hypothetical protein